MTRPAPPATTPDPVAANATAHNRLWRLYERLHPEIFNHHEQQRIRRHLQACAEMVRTRAQPRRALDYGCGTGNLTRHLLALGFHVTAADIAERFTQLVSRRYGSTGRVETVLLGSAGASSLPSGRFHLTCAFSVLHHAPDYLHLAGELMRVTAPGGIVYLGNEACPSYWQGADPVCRYEELVRRGRLSWRRFLRPQTYALRLLRMADPAACSEGDLHCTAGDHVEWDATDRLFAADGWQRVLCEDFLAYNALVPFRDYGRLAGICADTRCAAYRRPAGQP